MCLGVCRGFYWEGAEVGGKATVSGYKEEAEEGMHNQDTEDILFC